MTLLLARDLFVVPPGASAPVLRDVSISLDRGEWVGLTGPNGGGKTSLILGLSGLWPVGGQLLLHGAPFGPGTPADLRRSVAVIFQDPSSQLLQSTVFDELAFSPRNLGLPEPEVRRRAGHWAGKLGLSADLDRDPSRLSAGRQQLVLLGAALAGEPEILFADEPTAHLDGSARGRVLDLVEEEVGRGLAVLWATQSDEETRRCRRWSLVGDPGASLQPTANAALDIRPTPPRLRIGVQPSRPPEGPVVATSRAVEIVIGARGVTGLVGPNGAGKSVVLMAAAGLIHPEQVRVDWVTAPDPPPIAALQYPEQQIFEDLVSDEITFGSVARARGRTDALKSATLILEELGLAPEPFLGRRTWGLSTGEKRLLEVVAALIAPASVYLLDEPTAGLDPRRRQALAGIVLRFSRQAPLLIATQDRNWLLQLGAQIVEFGPVGGSDTP